MRFVSKGIARGQSSFVYFREAASNFLAKNLFSLLSLLSFFAAASSSSLFFAVLLARSRSCSFSPHCMSLPRYALHCRRPLRGLSLTTLSWLLFSSLSLICCCFFLVDLSLLHLHLIFTRRFPLYLLMALLFYLYLLLCPQTHTHTYTQASEECRQLACRSYSFILIQLS